MADYTKRTGVDGTMMIRDTGTNVEFWVTSGNSTTWTSNLQYTVVANGSFSGVTDYDAGQGWKKLRTVNVTTDQTVSFTVDTNTSGIGGPTTLTAVINRTSVPAAPSKPTVTSITGTTATVKFTGGDNGGLAIDNYQVWYGKTSGAADAYVNNVNGSAPLTGLLKGTTYYVKVRAHNSKGYSAYSAVTSFKTLIEPPAPSSVVISNVRQSSVDVTYVGNGDGGSPILEWQLAYGTDPNTPQKTATVVTGTISGLTPGMKHYFWARGRNSVGWGPYSVVSTATLLAGVRFKVGNTWVTAVPYVNVAGVWKPAKPFAKIAGLWKETG